MDPDDLKGDWQNQTSRTRPMVDVGRLIEELRRDDRQFNATIFWRDVREIGVCLLMLPLWIYLGIANDLPWTWYLTVPALLWIAGFMLAGRMRHGRRPSDPGEPLRRGVEMSLAQVEHQIRLLRRVHWWYLLPIALAMLAFSVQVTWRERSGGWLTALNFSMVTAIVGLVFAGVYRVNQLAVRASLEPRRRELEALLTSLADEPPEAG